MDSFLFCLLLVAAIGLGAKDQIMVAQLSDSLAAGEGDGARRPVPLLVLGITGACMSAAVMAYAGMTMAQILPRRAALMLIAFALAIAAFELFWPVRIKAAAEPTRSLGAIGLVLLWRQFGDAARFTVFAFAAGAAYPLTAFIGGALGGVASVSLGWSIGHHRLKHWPLRYARLAMGVALIIAAIFIGLGARYATL
ncbi:MAG: hypothetical protein SXU28_01165 [Pseudomonadota bacterium]|nr:hypothetical protein [Pseudomonadota bacterium]